MTTTTKISESKKRITFFRDLRWKSSTSPKDKKSETFWRVRTNLRKVTFIQYMKMKAIYQGLPEDELQLLLDIPGVLEDDLFVSVLRTRNNGKSLKDLDEKLELLFKLGLIDDQISSNLFYTIEGTIAYQIFVDEQAIRKFKKFSGYVRNSSSVGSKKGNKIFQHPEVFVWTKVVEYDYYTFLNSVGELSLGAPGGLSFTLTSPKRTKRKNK